MGGAFDKGRLAHAYGHNFSCTKNIIILKTIIFENLFGLREHFGKMKIIIYYLLKIECRI